MHYVYSIKSNGNEAVAIYKEDKDTRISPSRLNEQRLGRTFNEKHLDVIRDPKLYWKLNIELSVKKAAQKPL